MNLVKFFFLFFHAGFVSSLLFGVELGRYYNHGEAIPLEHRKKFVAHDIVRRLLNSLVEPSVLIVDFLELPAQGSLKECWSDIFTSISEKLKASYEDSHDFHGRRFLFLWNAALEYEKLISVGSKWAEKFCLDARLKKSPLHDYLNVLSEDCNKRQITASTSDVVISIDEISFFKIKLCDDANYLAQFFKALNYQRFGVVDYFCINMELYWSAIVFFLKMSGEVSEEERTDFELKFQQKIGDFEGSHCERKMVASLWYAIILGVFVTGIASKWYLP